MLFEPLLEPHAHALFERELRSLGRVFGERRDRDVLCLQTLPDAAGHLDADWIGQLRQVAEADRAASFGPVREALQGAGLTGLVLGLAAWCEDGIEDPARLGDRKSFGKRLDALAPRLLDRLARKVKRRIADAADAEGRHALRKSLKKLRYGTEFVAGLYRPKAVKAYRHRCETLQELLGTINDAHVTPGLVGGLIDEQHTELAPAVGMLAAWIERRGDKAIGQLEDAIEEFRAAKPFWH